MPLFSQLAQTYTNSYTTTDQQDVANYTQLLTVTYIAALPFLIAEIAGLWKVFTKAGRPGWAALIPVYNMWVLFEIAGKPGWWALLMIPALIPFLGYIVAIVYFVLYILAIVELTKRFGKGAGFAVLTILVPFVGFPMLGYGKAQYNAGGGSTPSFTPNGPTPPQGPTAPVTSMPPTPTQTPPSTPTPPQQPTPPTFPTQNPPTPPAPTV